MVLDIFLKVWGGFTNPTSCIMGRPPNTRSVPVGAATPEEVGWTWKSGGGGGGSPLGRAKGAPKKMWIRTEIIELDPEWGLSEANEKLEIPGPQTGAQRLQTKMGRFRCVSTTIRNFSTAA